MCTGTGGGGTRTERRSPRPSRFRVSGEGPGRWAVLPGLTGVSAALAEAASDLLSPSQESLPLEGVSQEPGGPQPVLRAARHGFVLQLTPTAQQTQP